MTVGELIEQLQDLDPDLVVILKQGKFGFVESRQVSPGAFDEENGEFQPDEDEEGGNDAVLIS